MLTFSALSGVAMAGDAPPRPGLSGCIGRTVGTVSITGCETTSCATTEAMERLRSLSGLGTGEILDEHSVALTRQRFAKTGLFRETRVSCSGGYGDISVTIEVVPNTFVHRVRVHGNQFFKARDILKRVFLRSGSVLNADPERPHDDQDVKRQIESITRLYRGAGLEDVEIEARLARVSESAVDVELRIREGERQRIDRIDARHIHGGEPDPMGLACPHIPSRRLERLVGVDPGDVYTSTTRRAIRDRLRRAFQGAGFVRPRVEVEASGEPLRVQVSVKTDKCWVIRVWERESDVGVLSPEPAFRATDPVEPNDRSGIAGGSAFRRAPLSDWDEVLSFAESGVFDREEAQRGAASIRGVLHARGFPFADVTLEHRELALRDQRRGTASEVRGVIDYAITRNHERRVHGIALEGHSGTLAAEELYELMQTKVYDFFGASGHFDVDRVLFDLTLLKRHYQERGFYAFDYELQGRPDDALVQRTSDLTADGWVIWTHTFRDRGFRLKKRRGELGLYLEIPFTEGPRTTIRTFGIRGASEFAKRALADTAGLSAGAPFGTKYLSAALKAITTWYKRRGYHSVTVTASCRIVGEPDAACDPSQPVAAPKVDLDLKVVEGKQVFVGELFWQGLFETSPEALTRDMPKPGEPLNQAKLDEGMRKLRALGIFNSVRIDTIGLDEDPPRDKVALVVSVEETGYRFFDIAGGVRSIQRAEIERVPRSAASVAGNLVSGVDRATTGFGRAFPLDIPDILLIAELEYLDLNMRGLGHELRLPLRGGFSFSELLRLMSFTPTYVWRRFLDSPVQLELKAIAELDRFTDPLDRLEFAGEVDLAWKINRAMSTGLTFRGGAVQLQDPTADCVFCEGKFERELSVSLRWRWDKQDNPLHPSRGFALTASTSLINARDRFSETGDFNNFFKYEVTGRMVLHFGSVVLAFFGRYGAGGSLSSGEPFLPANERFTLGGSNGLRGFSDNAVCRYDEEGELDPDCPEIFGGNVIVNGTMELRVPVLKRVGIWVAAFMDVGGLAKSHDEFHYASLRASAGVGVRWLILGQIPVRLDIGFPLFGRRCLALNEDAPCTLEDSSTPHFDFLYTF